MAALLNADSGDVERISFLITEAKQNGVNILPPDINASFATFTPEGPHIRFGLGAVKNVGNAITQAMIEERVARGPFKNFGDLLSRVQHKDLNKKSLESLAKAGVFDSLGIERNGVVANMDQALRFAQANRKGAQNTASLFGSSLPAAELKLPPAPPASAAEKLLWEKELLGFYLSDHPLNAHKERLAKSGVRPISDALAMPDGRIVRIAGCVAQIKKIVTKDGKPMIFATVEDFSPQPMEVIIFNSTLEKTNDCWQENAVVLIEGKISHRNDEIKLVCDRVRKL